MNNKILTVIAVSGAIATSLLFSPFGQAQTDTKVEFICKASYDQQTSQSLPTTFVWYQGQKRALIRWEKQLGGKTPLERCTAITKRFQEAYDNGSLSFLTNGTLNNQSVICTAKQYGGNCVTLLMTLRPQDNSLEILDSLANALSGRGVGPVRHSSATPQRYYEINFQEALNKAPVSED